MLPRSLFSLAACRAYYSRSWTNPTKLLRRRISSEVENTNVGHSRFLAEASHKDKWKDGVGNARKGGIEGTGDEASNIKSGLGKLMPTSSHLFKLILPLNHIANTKEKNPPPTVFLLHPSQPLSHVSRLILSSLSPSFRTANISFVSFDDPDASLESARWSDSTDVGDFLKDAARSEDFRIILEPEDSKREHITVQIPSFEERTRYLQYRLEGIERSMSNMETLKKECDHLAHRGARRMALTGFGALVVYWGAVARLTFWDVGWDVMEPVTYLSGLTTVLVGYLWFLYQGREVSYSAVLHQSVSARRDRLYRDKGLDIDRFIELSNERKTLTREISKIAEDYDVSWRKSEKQKEKKEKAEEDVEEAEKASEEKRKD